MARDRTPATSFRFGDSLWELERMDSSCGVTLYDNNGPNSVFQTLAEKFRHDIRDALTTWTYGRHESLGPRLLTPAAQR